MARRKLSPPKKTSRNPSAARHLWKGAIVLAVAFLACDSAARLRAIWSVTDLRVDTSPTLQEVSTTATGYEANQHRLIVPAIGVDGYSWILQAERMIAGVEGWRVRHADYDGFPGGREVEWSSFLRWEVAAMAWLGTQMTAVELSSDGWAGRTRNLLFGPYRPGGLPMNLAVERVAPWTNTVNLVLFLLITVPVVAWRFGSVPATLLAMGVVAIYPLYVSFSVGYLDHHGLAATWSLLTVLFLVGGGAGWIRAEAADVSQLRPGEGLLWKWLPTRVQARRWFVASAIAGGVGLWESASSQVPTMVGLGIGALAGTAWFGRGVDASSPWRADPTLWRDWGRAGCAASVFFYFLEYFPSHFGWNLHVNHPLYALAWFGAGDLLYHTCEWIQRGTLGETPATARRAIVRIGGAFVMVGILPVTIALTSKYTFALADSLLWTLCADYIFENQSLFRQLRGMGASEILGRVSVAPLVLLPTVARLWRTAPRAARSWSQMWLLVLLVPSVIYAHGAFQAYFVHLLGDGRPSANDTGGAEATAHLLAAVCDLVAVGLLFVLPIRVGRSDVALPWKGLLSLALFPAAVLLGLALQQSRWLNLAGALSLGVLIVGCHVFMASSAGLRRLFTGTLALPIFLALLFIPFPTYAAAQWIRFDFRMPLTQLDLTQVITRDASYRIRQRLGKEPGVILSGPGTTTWMTYFGGFRGLGTLYSENLEGLKAAASIYSAPSADVALELIKKYGVTHIAVYSWDAFAEEYPKLWRGQRRSDPPPANAFILDILRTGTIPSWLLPIPYPTLPPDLANQYVRLFEVIPDQSVEEAAVRAAQYLWARDKSNEALEQLAPLLRHMPDYLPGLVCLARVQQSLGDVDGFRQTVQRVRSNLGMAGTMPLNHRVDLAVVMALADDPMQVREQLTGALRDADEQSIRRLLPDGLINLVSIAQQLRLTEEYARPYRLALSLLPRDAGPVVPNDTGVGRTTVRSPR